MKHYSKPETAEQRHSRLAWEHGIRKRHAQSLLNFAIEARNNAKDMAVADADPHCTPEWVATRVRHFRSHMRRRAHEWRAYLKMVGQAPSPIQADLFSKAGDNQPAKQAA